MEKPVFVAKTNNKYVVLDERSGGYPAGVYDHPLLAYKFDL